MGFQSQMSSTVAGGTRPTVLYQDEPASTASGIGSIAMLSRPLGAAHAAMLGGASLWAAVCGSDGVWPCGGAWPRETRVEGRRRPKMAEVAIVAGK